MEMPDMRRFRWMYARNLLITTPMNHTPSPYQHAVIKREPKPAHTIDVRIEFPTKLTPGTDDQLLDLIKNNLRGLTVRKV